MTREEAKGNLIHAIRWNDMPKKEALEMAIKALEQEPCEDVAKERYEDLCEYFGGAKDILKHREDFKAWLGRVKWHIHKAEELYEKYEYKKEPCEDAISRQGVIDAMNKRFDGENAHDQFWNCDMVMDVLRDMPSVKPM